MDDSNYTGDLTANLFLLLSFNGTNMEMISSGVLFLKITIKTSLFFLCQKEMFLKGLINMIKGLIPNLLSAVVKGDILHKVFFSAIIYILLCAVSFS